MTTAHQLARKLLAGGDYDILMATGAGGPHLLAAPVMTVESMSRSPALGDRVTKPCIVLTPEPSNFVVSKYGS